MSAWCELIVACRKIQYIYMVNSLNQNMKSRITKYIFFVSVSLLFFIINTDAQNIKSKVHSNKGYSLFGALTFNHQSVNYEGINTPFNYLYSSINNNQFKTGYSGGLRYDGISKQKNNYSFNFAISRVSTGTFYKNKYTIAPFTDDFSKYKAEEQFTTLSFAAHYKILLPVNDMLKHKFYLVLGPSIDYKISKMSEEHFINGSANRAFINGDFGAEFDNKGYYVLYAHYKIGKNLTKSAASFHINRFEFGFSMKLKDLF